MNKVEDIDRSPASERFPAGLTPPVETLDLAKSLLAAHHAEHCARRSRHHLKSAQHHA